MSTMDEYRQKISVMHGSTAKQIAKFFVENKESIITAKMVYKATGIRQERVRNGVNSLRVNGWDIENLSGPGVPAKWRLKGVGDRKAAQYAIARPQLNPLIEQVFR